MAAGELLVPAWCLAAATIVGEAGGEPYEGKVAVAHVIRNRMRTRYASDGTVAGTVLHPFQFSLWNTNERGRIRACVVLADDAVARDAIRAWEESATAAHPVLGAAVLYHADYVDPYWKSHVRFLTRIGRHLFYSDDHAAPRPRNP